MTALAGNLETALELARAGFAVFPCQSGGEKAKQPMPFLKWREASTTAEQQILSWWRRWPDAAIGLDLAKSNLIVIDADRHDADNDGVEAFGALMASHAFDPDSAPLVATPSSGNHHFFRQPEGLQLGNARGNLPPGVDVRGAGGYVIAPGTVMADGRFYELHGHLAEAPVLPDWLVSILNPPRAAPALPQPSTRPDISEIEELLRHIPADCGYHDWVAALMAVHAATGGDGLAIADAWSATGGAKYCGSKELAKKWRSFRRQGITIATLADLARRHGADLSAIAIRHNRPQGYDPAEAATAARRLIEHHDGSLADAETGEIVEETGAVRAAQDQIANEYPAGLVGDIARWIVATARRPQPELSIGAALAIVGTAAGRQFAGPTMSGTHLYVLGLAPTGKGKDHPLQQVGRIMATAGLGHHLGPSEFISMPAVVNFLMRKPLSLCAMDEFGGFMKRINSRRASGFETAISKIIRTMWSSSFAPYHTPEWATKTSVTIFAPALSLYGASTPEQFYSAMEGAAIEDGTLNRFLLINGRDSAPEREPEQDGTKVPDWIRNGLRSIYGCSGDMATTWRNDPAVDPAARDAVRVMAWCEDGAQARYSEFSAEIEKLIEKDGERGAFYARTVETALRIATIVAIGRMEDGQVRIGDLEYGIGLSRRSSELLAQGAAEYMAENENQANAQKVMRILKANRNRIRYRDLVRALQHSVKARDLRDLLGAMCEAGQLERQEVAQSGGGHPICWYKIT